ncbi:hypothetical protein SH139x_000822 [Planctomycetaceae bacterium SH139]
MTALNSSANISSALFLPHLLGGGRMHSLLLLICLCWQPLARGDDSTTGNSTTGESPAANQPRGLTASFGIAQRYQVGRWTQLRIEGATAGQQLEIETLDGDGVRILQRVTVPAPGRLQHYLPAGPLGAPLTIRPIGEDGLAGSIVWRTRLSRSLATEQRPWVVALGDALGMDKIGRSLLLGDEGSLDVSLIGSAEQLPDHWIGYDGVDWVVLSSSGLSVVEAMTPAQVNALRDWLAGGGQMFLSLGTEGAALLRQLYWLPASIGAVDSGELVQVEPESIETFIAASAATTSFPATRLQLADAQVLRIGQTTGRESLPLVFRRQFGIGTITVFSGGLDSEPLASWRQREDFMNRMIPELFPERRQRGQSQPRADVRYGEMAGQLKTSLDQFAGASRVQFSAIAAILLCLIGFIGPIDYFLINRFLGRPLLGWLSFPLMIISLSAAILLWRGSAPPARISQVTVVDMDVTQQVGRGTSWLQVFAGEASRFDISVQPSGPLAGSGEPSTIIGPWGFAGRAFGGIEVAGEDVRLPAYALRSSELPNSPTSTASQTAQGGDIANRVAGLPLAPLSSKSLSARWQFPSPVTAAGGISKRPASELLAGSLINPLPVDLLEGYLVYRNLVYVLPTRVPAGGLAANLDALQPKNFRWRLNRRRTSENASISEPWDRAATDDLDRLMEVILFYQAAGGDKYTGLDNRVLSRLDLTSVLASDRAILVGRLAENEATVKLSKSVSDVTASAAGAGEPASTPETIATETDAITYVRVILPVSGGLAN